MKVLQITVSGWKEGVFVLTEKEANQFLADLKKEKDTLLKVNFPLQYKLATCGLQKGLKWLDNKANAKQAGLDYWDCRSARIDLNAYLYHSDLAKYDAAKKFWVDSVLKYFAHYHLSIKIETV